MSSSHEITIEVAHNKKKTNVSFRGTLPVLDAKEAPHEIVLNGPCGIVSEDSSEYLFTVGSFGTKISEDALDQYIEIQKAVLSGEDVSSRDMFFLLDSVRRSHRRKAEDAAAEPPHTLLDTPDLIQVSVDTLDPSRMSVNTPDPSRMSVDGESDHSPAEGRASSPDSSDDDAADAPSTSPDRSAAAGDPESAPARRRLVLQPEEVLFLSHALGCVRVTTADGAELAGERLYCHLSGCEDRHLAARYAAYLDLRGRGWVVRDGLLSGADFVVYRRGPAFYHASLVATVQVVSAETRRLLAERNWREADWLYTAGLCRTAEQAAKDVLLVRLLWPDDLGQPSDLSYLHRVAVQHVLVRRSTPGRLS